MKNQDPSSRESTLVCLPSQPSPDWDSPVLVHDWAGIHIRLPLNLGLQLMNKVEQPTKFFLPRPGGKSVPEA